MSRPLEGRTIGLAEARQLEELAAMLEKEGATVLRCPLVAILDAPDEAAVEAWLRDLVAGRFDLVILYTGEGLRRLLGFAERSGLREAVVAALGRTHTLTRGPKPVRALQEVGLAPSQVAEAPTTEGLIATLRHQPLRGQTVGVQLYKEEATELLPFLEAAGATVRSVLPYVYAPASDADRVAELVERMAGGDVHAVVFTSSPQVDRLFEVASEKSLEEKLRQGLQQTRIAAVGPIVAENLRRRGADVSICPEQGFVMKNLVHHIKRQLGAAR
jgi:uroporphyrinogen-III synthase